MAVATVNAVIWEWQRDDGGYAPYHPEVSHAIEETHKSGRSILNLGTLSKGLSPYQLDMRNYTQTRTNTGMVRSIRRTPIQISGTPCNAIWEWQDGSLHYNFYSIHAMMEIEGAYRLKQSSVDLSQQPSQLPYIIDFSTMYQTRRYYNTQRKIRRTPLTKPLQFYLSTESSLASPPVASGPPATIGTVSTFPLHSVLAMNTTFSNYTPGYTVSMPSVYSHPTSLTPSFGTTSVSTHSVSMAPSATVTSITSLRGKGHKGPGKTATALKMTESASKPPSKSTGRTKSPAKRYKTKATVTKPTTKSKFYFLKNIGSFFFLSYRQCVFYWNAISQKGFSVEEGR